jgi:hypothetical protein
MHQRCGPVPRNYHRLHDIIFFPIAPRPNISAQSLAAVAIPGMISTRQLHLETVMPKNRTDSGPPKERPALPGSQPPPLREDMIAKLQMAVNKARQMRTAQSASSDRAEPPSPTLQTRPPTRSARD